jgi:hypothetical protein
MNRALFIIFLFLLAGCSGNSDTPDKIDSAINAKNALYADSIAKATSLSPHQSSSPWCGNYNLYLKGRVANDIPIGWEYTINYSDSDCIFTGDGYQVAFKYRCESVFNNDTLFLKYKSDIFNGEEKIINEPSSTMIIKINNDYYLKSEKFPPEAIDKPTKNGYKIKKLNSVK